MAEGDGGRRAVRRQPGWPKEAAVCSHSLTRGVAFSLHKAPIQLQVHACAQWAVDHTQR